MRLKADIKLPSPSQNFQPDKYGVTSRYILRVELFDSVKYTFVVVLENIERTKWAATPISPSG